MDVRGEHVAEERLVDANLGPGRGAHEPDFPAGDPLPVLDQTHGGNGFTSDYDLLDIYSFLRLQRTAPVSREMILNYVGEHLPGMPKSY